MDTPVIAFFAGNMRPMPGDGQLASIFKQPVNGPVQIGIEGLIDAAQAGGVLKA